MSTYGLPLAEIHAEAAILVNSIQALLANRDLRLVFAVLTTVTTDVLDEAIKKNPTEATAFVTIFASTLWAGLRQRGVALPDEEAAPAKRKRSKKKPETH